MKEYDFESSNAFVQTFLISPYRTGELDELTFAVKDNIDIAGMKTSFGNQSWMDQHPFAKCNALCVEQLLSTGASCLGKTISDEFTYGLDGENFYYGTPLNPLVPDRIPGGSSSGSASAVACGLVDFALGTDCGGSVRVPASHCGIWGMRPTTHRISEAGVLPFAPSVSTVGVLSKDYSTLERVMQQLLNSYKTTRPEINNIYLLTDAFSLCDEEVIRALSGSIANLKARANVSHISISEIMEEEFTLVRCNEDGLRKLQTAEIGNALIGWVELNRPKVGPSFQVGFENVRKLERSSLTDALFICEKIYNKVAEYMKPGDLFCFPTVPLLPPLKGELTNRELALDYYDRTMAITSFSGLAQLPEISIPVGKWGNIPVGLSIVAANRQDEFLLEAVKLLFDLNQKKQ